ncbi:MAG: hypothetical protein WC728_10870 [Elusimicrobiota bacterium]
MKNEQKAEYFKQDPFFKEEDATATAPIPQLKKKEEERKGGGVAYCGARVPSNLVTAGSGVARIGANTAPAGLLGRAAAVLARLFGGESTWLGAFFMTQAGRVALLAGAVLFAGALAIAVLEWSGRFDRGEAGSAMMLPEVGRSSIVIDAPKDRSLGYVVSANMGELDWEGKKASAVQEAPAEKAEEAPQTAPEIPEVKIPDVEEQVQKAVKATLDRGAFLKGLNNTGKGWNFGGGLGMRDALASARLGLNQQLGTRGAVKPLKRQKMRTNVRSMSTLRGRSNRAMGQLKLARNLSSKANAAYGDARSRQYGTDAFEQGRTIGGTPVGEGIVVPPGVTDPEPDPNPDPDPPTPPSPRPEPPIYQPPMDNARNSGNDAAMLKVLGMLLLAMGAIMVAIGMKLLSNPFTAGIGAMLLAIGIALIAAGIACLAMSQQKANDAKGNGRTVSQQHGQDDQGQVVNECAEQAAQGISIENCRPSMGPDYFQQKLTNTVHADVEAERNATYTLE